MSNAISERFDRRAPHADVKAGFDVGIGGLEIAVGFEAVAGKIDALHESVKELLRSRPTYPRISGSGLCPTPTATFAFRVATPPEGTIWHVLSVNVGGVGMTTSIAGAVFLFSGSFVGAVPGSMDMTEQAQDSGQFTSLPTTGFYLPGQFTVRAPEALYAIVTGGTAGQPYKVKANLMAEPDLEGRLR